MTPATLISLFLAYANRLRFRNLFLLVIGLFILDLIIPDFIPMIDELILGVLAVLLANWKKERLQGDQGTVIEGEVIDGEDKS